MDVDAAPVESTATLTPLAAGAPKVLAVRTLPEPGTGVSLGSTLTLLALLARRRRRAENRRELASWNAVDPGSLRPAGAPPA